MRLSEFEFNLPEELIAKYPTEKRDTSRLLVVHRKTKEIGHHHFFDLPLFLNAQDLIVLNNTRVIPARLFAKTRHGGEVEILLLGQKTEKNVWSCLVRPGRKVRDKLEINFVDGTQAFLSKRGQGYEINFSGQHPLSFFDWLEKMGHVPLPPYIDRDDELKDRTAYQTVYASVQGSVAAPTAGLHFTEDLLAKIRDKGIAIEEVTLHIGHGTFAPIQTELIADHRMHYEAFSSEKSLTGKIVETRRQGGRVLAVGTTAARTLESLPIYGSCGRTNLFIRPGYRFQNVDALLTNFHIPKSSLFVLVSSLLGVEWTRDIYQTAISEKYRFFSYGDAMLVL